jgi:invasion protein IalB
MSLRGRKMPGGARRRGAWPALRSALAGAAILVIGAGGGSIAAFAQAEGEAPTTERAPATPAPAAPPGPRDGKVLQDWTLRCQLPQPEQEICEMRQRIVDQNGNRVVLAVVGRLPNLDIPGLLILLPLGIALPPGTFLQIDQGEERRVQVERCESQGCRIELLLDDDLLPLLKAGSRASIGFHVYDGQGERPRVDVPISLIGFSAALAEVMQ